MNNEEQINIWTERIESYKARKGSALAWSKENKVPLSTLRYWMDKIDNRHMGQGDRYLVPFPLIWYN